ncbi:MAG: hypothetical protein H0V82_05890 [Candidatus Protochlamydia sp.]|nr:hypothetical protein [Candidatus Protochlamydia sp.]
MESTSFLNLSQTAAQDLEIFSRSKEDDVLEVSNGHFNGKPIGPIAQSNIRKIGENISVVANFISEINKSLSFGPNKDLNLKQIRSDIKNHGKLGHMIKHAETILKSFYSFVPQDNIDLFYKDVNSASFNTCHNELNKLLDQLEVTSSHMQHVLTHAHQNLKKSENGQNFYDPAVPSIPGINKTYIVLGNSIKGPQSATSKDFERLVLKPGWKENGEFFIPIGQGCLREAVAYQLQQLFMPCGIPETTLDIFSHSSLGDKSLCSAQMFAAEAVPLLPLNQKDQTSIAPSEIHKLVMDIVLFNTDRHLNNVLIQKFPVNEYIQNICYQGNLSETDLLNGLATSKDSSEFVSKMKSKCQNEQVLNMIQKLGHATGINCPFVYECVLIDHGGCIPDPQICVDTMKGQKYGVNFDEFLSSFWDTTRFEWYALPQTKEPFSQAMKEKIAQIDPHQVIELLQNKQQALESHLGLPISLPSSAINLVMFHLILVKEMSAQNFSLYQMKSLQNTEKMARLFFDKVLMNQNPDWTGIKQAVSSMVAPKASNLAIKKDLPADDLLDDLLDDISSDDDFLYGEINPQIIQTKKLDLEKDLDSRLANLVDDTDSDDEINY